jgi:hypothetical protein
VIVKVDRAGADRVVGRHSPKELRGTDKVHMGALFALANDLSSIVTGSATTPASPSIA